MSKFSDYLDTLSRANNLGKGHKIEWLFHCGMLFLSRDKWWGDFKFRHADHEGIDITYFRTDPDRINCFDDTVKVPAMADGVILNTCNDFLGKTLVAGEKNTRTEGRQRLLAYSHIIPDPQLKPGHRIRKGDIIARVCDTRKNPLLPPHLHLSCFETENRRPPENLDWTLFSNRLKVNTIHPVFL